MGNERSVIRCHLPVLCPLQGCAQDDLSSGYLPAKVVQNCSKCSISGLNCSVEWWLGRPPPTSVGTSLPWELTEAVNLQLWEG